MYDHVEILTQRHAALIPCAGQIAQAFTLLHTSLSRGGTLFLAGNGGSAADADHWSGELLKGFCKRRPLPAAECQSMRAEMASALQGGLRAIPLTGFAAFSTAFANDVDSQYVWAQLVYTLGRAGDVFIGLSTSGNAGNVCLAAEAARGKGLQVLGLTGKQGGRLKPLCDVCIDVPETETYKVQELHLPVYHCLALMVEDAFFAH